MKRNIKKKRNIETEKRKAVEQEKTRKIQLQLHEENQKKKNEVETKLGQNMRQPMGEQLAKRETWSKKYPLLHSLPVHFAVSRSMNVKMMTRSVINPLLPQRVGNGEQ